MLMTSICKSNVTLTTCQCCKLWKRVLKIIVFLSLPSTVMHIDRFGVKVKRHILVTQIGQDMTCKLIVEFVNDTRCPIVIKEKWMHLSFAGNSKISNWFFIICMYTKSNTTFTFHSSKSQESRWWSQTTNSFICKPEAVLASHKTK